MVSMSELEAMSAQDIESISPKTLKLVTSVKLDGNVSQAEKVLSFIEQIENPYCYLCGRTPVKICFTEDGKDINQALQNILRNARHNSL